MRAIGTVSVLVFFGLIFAGTSWLLATLHVGDQSPVKTYQFSVATLKKVVTPKTAPNERAATVGEPLPAKSALAVLRTETTGKNRWYQVAISVAGKPATGWIPAGKLSESGTDLSLTLDLARHRADVYERDAVTATYPIVGKPPVLTTGTYSLLGTAPTGDRASPIALVLSGEQETPSALFANHDALLGDSVAVVEGRYIRLRDGDLDQLAKMLPAGVRVNIVGAPALN